MLLKQEWTERGHPHRETTRRQGAGTASALILAVENGHFRSPPALVQAGAIRRSAFRLYPLHTLAWVRKPNRGDSDDRQPPPDRSGHFTSLQFVRQIVAYGADVNARLEKGSSGRGKLNMTGATAFLLASKTADVPYMKLLVELGADPLLPNKDGCSPLMAAAGIGTIAPTEEAGTEPEALAAVEYLLTLNADVNTVDQNGETATHAPPTELAEDGSVPRRQRQRSRSGTRRTNTVGRR